MPFCAVMSSPDSGSWPTTRGRSSSRSAVSRSTVARSMDLKMDAVRGLTAAAAFLGAAFFFGFVSSTSPVARSTAGVPSASSTTGASSIGASMASGSGSSSVTYGPNRPSFATMFLPLSGFTPITRSTTMGASMSSCALATVSSSGARPCGMLTRRGVASGSACGSMTSRYGPYFPMRSVTSSVSTIELMVLASMSPMLSMTLRRPRCFSPPK